jgi:hypothetical protein
MTIRTGKAAHSLQKKLRYRARNRPTASFLWRGIARRAKTDLCLRVSSAAHSRQLKEFSPHLWPEMPTYTSPRQRTRCSTHLQKAAKKGSFSCVGSETGGLLNLECGGKVRSELTSAGRRHRFPMLCKSGVAGFVPHPLPPHSKLPRRRG